MAGYQSEQSKILLEFLERHSETPMTIEAIAAQIADEQAARPPGVSTVYRLIKRMVEDGRVKRFVSGNSRRFVYQLAGREDCHKHLHLKCTSCGRLFHMDSSDSASMLSRVLDKTDFTIHQETTVLFGNCRDCPGGERKKA